MSVSARRFLQRRAEASSGAAAFAAGDASSPRASVPGDAARFSPGTAGGRFGAESAGSPGDDSASPERTTRLDYYPDDIVPTPRKKKHGDDTSGDEGVHPNDDPSSPTWHAAPHRSPLAFSFDDETKRSAPSATRRPPSIPRAGGMVVAPGPHADVLPRRHAGALRNGAFHGAGAGAPPRALRHPADDVDPAPARFPRAFGNRKHTKTKTKNKPATSPTATPTTARVSSWASPTRARHASAHPGGARGAPDRGTFSQAMREAETIASLGGEVAGARARLVALAGDVLETRESRASGRRRVRDPTRDRGDRCEKSIELLRPVSRLGVESELKRLLRVCSKDDETRTRNRKGADRRVAFFFHRRAGAPVAAAARRNEGWLTTQARPARVLYVTSNAKRPMKHTERDRTNVNVPRLAFGRSIDDVSRAATIALGSESRAAAAFAERDATARATGWAGRMASDAERVYADVWTDSLESLDSLEKQMGRSEKSQARVISTKTPRLWIRSGSADSARFRVGDVRHGGSAGT